MQIWQLLTGFVFHITQSVGEKINKKISTGPAVQQLKQANFPVGKQREQRKIHIY